MVGWRVPTAPVRLRCVRWCCLGLALLALGSGSARAESREYQIKAAFMVNFMQFVTWPSNAFTNADAPFFVGVLGDDPFGAALDQTVQGETVNHHKIIVQRARSIEDCKDCQMVFVSRSEEKKLPTIFAKLDSGPVLTVSETRDFARRGGIINFYLEGNKVRFEINPTVAQHANLKISAQLLSLGKIVQPAEGGP
ncbi:MAG TPA: YfiR family protein [Verrucomicrobiae bacterium]|nr:YfiR family protein [Verrucomicrobiae bacterium]